MIKFAASLVLSLVAAPAYAGVYTSLLNCEQVKASNNKADKWRDSVPLRWLPQNIGEAVDYINASPWCSMYEKSSNHYVVVGATTDGGTLPLGLGIHGVFKPPHYFPSMSDYRTAMKLCSMPADLALMPDGHVIRTWVSGKNAGHECFITANIGIGKMHSQGVKGK